MVQPVEEAAHPTGILSAMPARNRSERDPDFLRAVLVGELHVERIEAAEAGAEEFFAVLGETALVARAFELVVGRRRIRRRSPGAGRWR